MTPRIPVKLVAMAVTIGIGVAMSGSAHAATRGAEPDTLQRGASHPRLLASGLGASTGSTVGPDGGVYVVDGAAVRTDGAAGRGSETGSEKPRV